jgi:hypothetical protein
VWIKRIVREPSGSEMTRSTRRLEARMIKASVCPVAVADKQFLAVERLFGAVVLRLESRPLLRTSR